MMHTIEEDGPRRDSDFVLSTEDYSNSRTDDGRIVVPETIILTDQHVTDKEEQRVEPKPKLKFPVQRKQEAGNTLPKPRVFVYNSSTAQQVVAKKGKQFIGPSESVDHPTGKPNLLNFDLYGLDSLVFIHIQKTGGSDFLRHLVTATRDGRYLCLLPKDKQMDIQNNSIGRKGIVGRGIMCPRDPAKPDGEQWLICEKNLGWVCQLHSSYTEYKACLPKLNNGMVNPNSRFLYATILRHPVLRYLSEYLHFKRGAKWAKKGICGGKEVKEAEMPPCYPDFYNKKPWPNLTMDKFLACQSNWANNRQTLMLADLEPLGCYGNTLHPPEEKDRLMLESAKENIRKFAFFGLTEYQRESCALFERTFGVKLKLETEQRAMSALHSAPILQTLWNDSQLYDQIAAVNHLDMELYEYALQLFVERVKTTLGREIDLDIVSKEIESMRPEDVAKVENKYKRFNLHNEFKRKERSADKQS